MEILREEIKRMKKITGSHIIPIFLFFVFILNTEEII